MKIVDIASEYSDFVKVAQKLAGIEAVFYLLDENGAAAIIWDFASADDIYVVRGSQFTIRPPEAQVIADFPDAIEIISGLSFPAS